MQDLGSIFSRGWVELIEKLRLNDSLRMAWNMQNPIGDKDVPEDLLLRAAPQKKDLRSLRFPA